MTFSQGSRGQFAYVAESTYGTTPSTPSMIALRQNGHTLAPIKDTFVSDELRADGQIVDARHGVKRVSGDISFELSYGAFDDLLESAFFSTWSTNVLKAGTTLKSFTFEDGYMDLATPVYNVFKGCVINTMNLNITPNAMVTGTFGILGANTTSSTTALDASLTAAPTAPPFDGFSGSISEGGSTIASVTALEIALDNGLDPAYVVGEDVLQQVIKGRCNVTGTLTAYFESNALLNKFLNETESSVSVTLDGTSGDLTILLPRIKYTGAAVPREVGPRLYQLPFQALRDSSEATNIKITRIP